MTSWQPVLMNSTPRNSEWMSRCQFLPEEDFGEDESPHDRCALFSARLKSRSLSSSNSRNHSRERWNDRKFVFSTEFFFLPVYLSIPHRACDPHPSCS